MRVKLHNIRQANSKIEKRKQTTFYNNEGNIITVEKEKIKNCNHKVETNYSSQHYATVPFRRKEN